MSSDKKCQENINMWSVTKKTDVQLPRQEMKSSNKKSID